MIDNNIGTPEKEEAAPDKVVALKQILEQFSGNTGRTQCQRLLAALARFPVKTFEAMRFLDVYHCPARVLQLRKDGHDIITVRQTVVTEASGGTLKCRTSQRCCIVERIEVLTDGSAIARGAGPRENKPRDWRGLLNLRRRCFSPDGASA
jgi:hypothetical protein